MENENNEKGGRKTNNGLYVPIAIAGLLHPVIAEIAMALSSITVVTNANLLRRNKI